MNLLKIDSLNKTYANGVKALNNVSLEITNGMFGLLGPNGAGKSTLMKTIAGLQTADQGNIYFNDEDVLANTLFIKKKLGFLPQDFGVYPKISAYDLLKHLAVLKGVVNKTERTHQIDALLQKVNLYQHRKKAVSTFSGGMRQRFGIAQALLGDPKIVIVDEPTAGLDPEERNRFNSLLSEIGENIIVILSTHLVEDVRTLCTRMAVIDKGTVIVSGRPGEFINSLNGKLWQTSISKHESFIPASNQRVLSAQFNLGKMNIRIESQYHPGDGFKLTEPNLEDAYFSILNNSKLN